ncbi:MAG: CopY family transcriptional regulator [Verrucomicrobiales bacterium]|nr:CopY family transcriptional regulator [Verrucomicrobiales bacterium]|tara:strand:+ start:69 stop:452 length:384 start_codon:yes stop_codon:yes gene_type:complete
MNDFSKLSRRERQIVDILFARGEATALQIQEALPNAPSTMAIRRMLSILEEKGQLKRRKEGREFVYMPKQARKRAGANAMQHMLDTFFGGSVEEALATHLERPRTKVSDDELKRLSALIQEARKQVK